LSRGKKEPAPQRQPGAGLARFTYEKSVILCQSYNVKTYTFFALLASLLCHTEH
jgi:hypothetical protein